MILELYDLQCLYYALDTTPYNVYAIQCVYYPQIQRRSMCILPADMTPFNVYITPQI